MTLRAIEWRASERVLRILNQRALPDVVEHLHLRDPADAAEAIYQAQIVAPTLLGLIAAYAIVLAAQQRPYANWPELRVDLDAANSMLRSRLPAVEAVFAALDRMRCIWQVGARVRAVQQALADEAEEMERADIENNHMISRYALTLLPRERVTFFHHGSTGLLATAGHGTAMGIVRSARASGREVMVYLGETRPRLLGSRLSAFELQADSIRHVVVADGAAAHVMRARPVDAVVVGCDRLAANGDLVNATGTYAVALAARDNGIPFYVAAPCAAIDLDLPSGDLVGIAEHQASDVTEFNARPATLLQTPEYHPIFDTTPARLISAVITERGIAYPPFTRALTSLLGARPWN